MQSIGSFTFDADIGELRDNFGKPVRLRAQSLQVLSVLLSRRGEMVSKSELMEAVWPETHVTDDSLVQCISEIRKVLGPANSRLLKTIPKKGYMLAPAELRRASLEERLGMLPGKPWVAVLTLALAVLFLWATWFLSEPVSRQVKTVAVLPFVNMSGDGEQDYFSTGLAEDLLTDLSKINALTVLSRSATFHSRSPEESAKDMATSLGASHLVDGSVRREGDRLRISVQLVDAQTGASLWAERYDRELGDLFVIQDDVRSQIITALAVRLVPGEADRIASGNTVKVSAYDLLLKGRHEETALTREGVTRAISFYKQAIAADPEYGDAYARLANMYDFAARFGWNDAGVIDRKLALTTAETAVRVAPQNPFAHWTLGRILARQQDGDPEMLSRALGSVSRAIELDPKNADAYAFISLLHIGSGRPAEAKRTIETAFRLNPEAPSWYVQNRGIISFMDGDMTAAVSDFERAAEKNPTASFTRLWLAAAYAQADRGEDAEWQLEEAAALGAPTTIRDAISTNPIFQDAGYRSKYEEGLRRAGLAE
ncbi:winged helix-turn-helix domain-containing protein [Roseibium sp.]|uniref:winged helix-turn-helix domain-containing protein n=1 Tax=Roseibium sp. TaxID=1936156 RepID=UPI003D0D2767